MKEEYKPLTKDYDLNGWIESKFVLSAREGLKKEICKITPNNLGLDIAISKLIDKWFNIDAGERNENINNRRK